MAKSEDKKLHPPQWLGRPILAHEHHQDLEMRAAMNEYHHKMPRQQAEQHAHDAYVKEHRERAAGHHLAGMKAAMATGNHQDARKHWAMYDMHLKALGKDSIGAVPPEVEKRMMDEHGQSPLYRFKAHKGDLYALHEPSKDVAPAEGTPIQKAEAGQCKWRLGERRCQRKVSSGYCHDHVDHWANKIKQKDHDALEKAGLPGEKPPAPAPAAAPKPAAPAPAGTAHLQAPKPAAPAGPQAMVLHSDPNKFLAGLKALPQGSPERGKYLTAHAGHAPLKAAMMAHPALAPMWGKLTAHLDGRGNAGFRPGNTKIVVKTEAEVAARQLLKAVAALAKGSVIQFPGNKAPAVDQGKAASVSPMPQQPLKVPTGWTQGVHETMEAGPQHADPHDYSHLVPAGQKFRLRVTPQNGGHTAEIRDPAGLVVGTLHGKHTGNFIDRGYWGVKDPEMAWTNAVPQQHRQMVPWMQMAIHQARGSED